MHFEKVVNDAVEPPLDADLLFSSEAKSIKAEARSYVGKDGFYRCHPSSVDQLACYRVDLLPHFLRESLCLLIGLSRKVGELTGYGHVGVLHALRPD